MHINICWEAPNKDSSKTFLQTSKALKRHHRRTAIMLMLPVIACSISILLILINIILIAYKVIFNKKKLNMWIITIIY